MTLSDQQIAALNARLKFANEAVSLEFPGNLQTRQPVHSFYGGAHLFNADVCMKLGKLALRSLDRNGPFPGVTDEIAEKVREKLTLEPIEDYRIDFEDGYGIRSDAEEDGHAESAAHHVAKAYLSAALPPFYGIRIKPLTEESCKRAIRTLDLFLTTLLEDTGGILPANFIVTLPKVTTCEQPAVLVDLLEMLEHRLRIPSGTLGFELMVETTQSVLMLPEIIKAARGRCTGAHFGTYDYTAAIGIGGAHQNMLHPACDFARNMMQAALAGRGIFLSDGGTNVMPVGNLETVQLAWQLHFQHVHHSLVNAFYQGWDLHPAQLVSRYAAVFSFFRNELESTASRLQNFLAQSARATLTGEVFDDAASALGLKNYLQRALNCGAVSREELHRLVGLWPNS